MKPITPRPEFRNSRTSAAILLALFTLVSPLSPLFAVGARAQGGKLRPAGDGRAEQPADKGAQQGGEGTAKSPGLAAPQAVAAGDLKVTMDDGVAAGGTKRPGETVTYTVTIRNTHATDAATNVKFLNDLSANLNLSLVGGTVQTQPLARPDAYLVVGNVKITVPNGPSDLLGNDTDPDTGDNSGLTATAQTKSSANCTGACSNNVVINADGSFEYNPPAGFTGTDTFTYAITDGASTGVANDTGTVTLTVGNGTATPGANVIWFVDDSAQPGGDGRLTSPFNCYTGADSASQTCFSNSAADEDGDTVFLFSGNYTGGHTLLNTQKLVGQGATDTLATIAGVTVPTFSQSIFPQTREENGGLSSPEITATTANGVNLAQNNVLRGFNVGNVGNANRKISGAGFGQLTVGKTGAGEADVVLSGTGMALFLQNGTIGANSAFNGVTSTGSTAQGILLTQITAGTLNFTGTNVTASGNGIEVNNSQADINFGNTEVSAGTNGVVLANNSGGTRTFGTLSIAGGSGVGFSHFNSGGAATVSGAMTVTNPGGNGIDIDGSNANLSFAATTVSKNAAGIGVDLTNNSGRTISFTSLTATTTNAFALNTNNSGTVTAGGGSLTQNGAGGGAASLTNTALGLNFTTVSSTNGANGLIFNVASGTFASGTTTLTTNAGIGLLMLSSSVAANFGNTTVTGSAGDAVDISGQSGNVMFAALNLSPNAGLRGLDVSNTTGTITSTSGNVVATNAAAININGPAARTPLNLVLTNVDATFNANSSERGVLLNLVSGNLAVNDPGTATTITGGATTTGNGIEVTNSGAGTINFGNTSVTGTGNGNADAAGTGIFLNNNAGAITFGALTLTPDANERGLHATDTDATAAGLVTIGSGTITASNNVAVEITGQAAGNRTPLNIQLTALNANGGARGLVLNNTSAAGSPGGFRVLGTGTTDGSGGAIQNTDTRGADIQNADSILLRNMNFTNANDTNNGDPNDAVPSVCIDLNITGCNSAIYLNGVTTLATLDNLNVTGTMVENGITAIGVQNLKLDNSTLAGCGDAAFEGCFEGQNLSGTSTVTNTTINLSEVHSFDVVNTDTTWNLTVSGSTFSNTQTSGGGTCPDAPCNGGGGIQFRSFSAAGGTPTTTMNILNSSFPNIRTQGIQAIAEDDTILNIDIVGNSIDSGPNNNQIGVAIDLNSNDTAQLNFNVLNNPVLRSRDGHVINITAFGNSKGEGRVNDNGSLASPIQSRGNGAGGFGLRFVPQDTATMIAEARRNFIHVVTDIGGGNNSSVAIEAQARFRTARLDLTLDDNTTVVTPSALADINLTAGSSASAAPDAPETNILCANLVSNNASNLGANILRLRVSDFDASSDPKLFLEGFVEAGTPNQDASATWNAKGNTPPSTSADMNVSLTAGASEPSAPPGGTCQTVDTSSNFAINTKGGGDAPQSSREAEQQQQSQQPLVIPGMMITPPASQPQAAGQVDATAAAQPGTAAAQPAAAPQPKAQAEKSAAAEGSKAGDGKSKKDGSKGGVATPRLGTSNVDVTIGTLPAGDEVTITFQATIAPTLSPASAESVSNQGTLTADGGISKQSDDPQTTPPAAGEGNDATVTAVNKFEPAIDLASSDATSDQGESVTFTATLGLGTAPGAPAPTGTVNFVDTQGDADPTNDEVLCANVAISGATAECATTAVDAGTRTIAAIYSGDGRYDPATNTVTQTVTSCLVNPVVTSTADDGSAGTLRHAITNACVGTTITFDISGAGPHVITLTASNGELLIDKNLTITGPTGESVAVSGGTIRALHVTAGTVSISNLTVSDSDPTAVSGGGGLFVENAASVVTLTGMTFTGNSAQGGTGGAIVVSADATLNVINTTISGNAANSGGAIDNSLAVLNLVNVTMTNNDANNGDTGTPGAGAGGGILNNSGTTNVRNSIITGNLGTTGAENVSGAITDQGNNLIGVNAGISPTLASNGGPTQTHALLAGSAALDAGNNCVLTAAGCAAGDPAVAVTTDQRGFDRAADAADADTTDTVDIGAFEAQASVQTFADASIAQDGTHTVTDFNVGDADSNLTVTATSDNTALVPNDPANLAVNAGSSASQRTLVVKPVAGQTGTANITVTVTDNGSGTSMSDTFVLTVAALETPVVTITADNPDPSLTGQAVTVTYTVTGSSGTPTGSVTVTASGGGETCTASVAAGQCDITLMAAGNRTLTATYSGDLVYSGGADTEAHAVLPSVTISDATASEASQLAVFTVHLSSASTEVVTINFTTADGGANPATAGADYTSTSGHVDFQPGQTLQTISVPVANDGAGEADETFLVNLTTASNANVAVSPADNQATGTITENNPAGAILISEIRTSGPGAGGSGDLEDDFVELYNNSDTAVTVPAGGWGVFQQGALCTDQPVLIATIPGTTTVIPARGHYLITGSGYSLTAAAAGDQSFSQALEVDRNVGLFSTTDPAQLSAATRLDAVGFFDGVSGISGNCDLLREGTPLSAAQGSTSQHSFFRKLFSGRPQDTGRSVDDFMLVSTTPSAAVGFNNEPALGAPGPERSDSPIQRNDRIKASLIDPMVSNGDAPNSVRRQCAPMDPLVEECNPTRSQNGTFSIRRRWKNTTGEDVTVLRFRLVNVTTGPTPPAGTADLRALNSGQVTGVTTTDGSTVTVEGTTLDAPSQALGGGFNSTLSAGTVTLADPLVPNESINLQFLLGVQQPGAYTFFVNVEAGPPPSGVLMSTRQAAPAKEGVNKGTRGGRQ